ncbi:MAG TPA: MFS transporter [Pseudonocardiaceae bacterium]|nr:MFS transporter [Pseudonocardiaceae bacterium]
MSASPDNDRARAPLAGHYPFAVLLALLALCPYLVLSTASPLLNSQFVHDLHTTMFGTRLADGLANAGYAFGAVAAADLIQRFSGRTLFLACEIGFVVGSVVAAAAPGIAVFTAGRTVQGVATGMLLVAALPPLVTGHGSRRLPTTALFVNLGLFGMVTLGPVVGGVTATAHAWRALLVGVAVVGLAGWLTGRLAFAADAPGDLNRGMGFDWSAIPVAAAATVLPFVGVSWLSRDSFGSTGFLMPLVTGLAALVLLVVRQYRKAEPLMPVRLLAHTLPVTGVSAAMVAGAGFTTLIELVLVYLTDVTHQAPLAAGLLLVGQIVGVGVGAIVFRVVLRTRWLPVLTFTGLGSVAAGGALVLVAVAERSVPAIACAAVLLGFGAGAGVTPGLFMAGLSAPSTRIGPTFALVELLRSEAAFLLAPVLLRAAMSGGDLVGGVWRSSLVVVVLTGASAVVLVGLLLLGGARPHEPDLDGWLAGENAAFHSPALAAVVREG